MMECFCEGKQTVHLKIEGDVGADPIWCDKCGCNLDLDDIPVSEELKSELSIWASKYGEWIDWNKDELLFNGVELEEQHNEEGNKLTEKVKEELKANYKINFSPSSMGKSYAKKR